MLVQEAVEEARYYSEKVWSADHVTEAAHLWTIAVNTIASYYDRGNALTMMSALELAIMDIDDLACHVAVPAGELVAVIDQACVLHLRIAEFAEPEEGILLEWLTECSLAHGFIPCNVEGYAPLLGDDVCNDLPRLKKLMERIEPVDADVVLALIFVKIRAHMHLAMGTWSKKTAAYNALDPDLDHITELYHLISDSPAAVRAWRREVERVDQEFRGYPEVAEGIAERGFMRWGL